MPRTLTLNYQEAVHLASVLRRLRDWDSTSVVRIQTRGKVVAFWSATPMDCLAFVALPLASPVAEDFDVCVFVTRLRDILGDLSSVTDSNRIADYPLPDDLPVTLQLSELPPSDGWLQADQQTCGTLSALVDNAIAEFHKQTAMLSNPNRAVLDMVAADIWKGPGVANFPLKGLHAARQLGFLSHVNARVQISTSGKWQRLITPAGQLFFDTQPARPKLRVI